MFTGAFLDRRDRLPPAATRHEAPDWMNALPRGLLLRAFKPEPTWRLVWKHSSLNYNENSSSEMCF